jgi:hypothetical protein
MNSTLEFSAGNGASAGDYQGNGSPAWEYRFLLQEEWSPAGTGLVELAPEGWVVASFRMRLDNRREYLLKRPRK